MLHLAAEILETALSVFVFIKVMNVRLSGCFEISPRYPTCLVEISH